MKSFFYSFLIFSTIIFTQNLTACEGSRGYCGYHGSLYRQSIPATTLNDILKAVNDLKMSHTHRSNQINELQTAINAIISAAQRLQTQATNLETTMATLQLQLQLQLQELQQRTRTPEKLLKERTRTPEK